MELHITSMFTGPSRPLVEAKSESRCLNRMVKGIHVFTLEKYSLWKGVGYGGAVCSNSFTVGSHVWAIFFFPDGTPAEQTNNSEKKEIVSGKNVTNKLLNKKEGNINVGIRVGIIRGSGRVSFRYRLTLLDQSGEGKHQSISNRQTKKGSSVLDVGTQIGSSCFISRDLLENSPYLKDDCLKIECELGILLPPETEKMTPSITVPQCDVARFDFLGMLETGEGSDVIFNVGGKEFRAHKVILSARSSAFESMLASHQQQEVVITGVEPRVFKAMLHFIYSDTLPKGERSLVDGYAFGPSVSSTFSAKLLAAADTYYISRLKSICECHLWRSISLSRFAETLMVADRCNASVLKNLCFGFAVNYYEDLLELDSFNELKKKCPLLLSELVDHVSREKPLPVINL